MKRSINFKRAVHLAGMVLWRSVREQRKTLFLGSILTIALIVVVSFLSYVAPDILTSFSARGLERGAAVLGLSPQQPAARLSAFLALQAPYFVASFVAVTTAGLARDLLAADMRTGALELYLASGLSIAEMALGNLMAVLGVAFALTAVFVMAWSACLAGASQAIDLSLIWRHIDVASLLLFVISSAIVSALTALLLGLLAPSLSGLGVGMSITPVQLISSLPALAMTVAVSQSPALTRLVLPISVSITVVCCILSLWLLSKFFDPRNYVKS